MSMAGIGDESPDAGTTRMGQRRITLALVALAASLGNTDPARAERYALLVGVRQYDADGLRPLDYPEEDVGELAQVLLAGGYRSANVRLLTQHIGATQARYLPTGRNIRRELKLLIDDRQAGDTVLVAFAGHGVQFRGGESKYFCPMDAELGDPGTLVPLDEVFAELGRSAAGLKVLMVDACRDDPLVKNTRGRPVASLESLSRPLVAPPPGGVAAFFSCSAGEVAFEDPKLRHGVFFHFVIEGLKGAAVTGEAREVTLPELEIFVKRRVESFVKENHGRRQMPEIFNQSRGVAPLVAFDEGLIAFRRGVVSAGRGDYARAVAEFTEALRARPHAASYAHRALCRYFLAEPDRAISDADSALRLDPDHSLALLARGMAFDAKDDLNRAIADFGRAARLDPENPAAWGFLGLGHRKIGQGAEGRAAARRAIALEARDSLGYLGRGDALLTLGDNEGAIRAFDEVLRLGPNFLAYNNRGTTLSHLGQFDRALVDIGEAIRLTPGNPMALVNRCWLYLGQGRLDAAEADANAALAIEPGAAVAQAAKASLLAARGDLDGALVGLNRAIATKADVPLLLSKRAEVHRRRGDDVRAVADADEALRLDPEMIDALIVRASVRHFAGDHRRALVDYEGAIRLSPKLGWLQAARAESLVGLGQVDRAIEASEAALKLDPGNAHAFAARALARLRQGDNARAIQDCDAALRLTPAAPIILERRATAHFALGDLARASADCDEALRVDRNYYDAWMKRAAIRQDQKAWALAIEDANQAARLRPNDPLPVIRRATIRINSGDHVGAVDDLTAAIRLSPQALLHERRAFLENKLGRGPAAIADATEALRLDPNLAAAYSERAYAYNLARRHAEAVADCDAALKINPRLAVAYSNRGYAYKALGDPRADADFRHAERLRSEAKDR